MSDCMTQEDAEKMDNRQAVEILKPLRDMMRDQHGCPISDAFFALNKAIEALSAQPDYDLSDYSDRLWKAAYERGKAEAEVRWIPVTERLPEKHRSAIVTDFGHVTFAYTNNLDEWMDYDGNRLKNVTAWMPLPEPYRKERRMSRLSEAKEYKKASEDSVALVGLTENIDLIMKTNIAVIADTALQCLMLLAEIADMMEEIKRSEDVGKSDTDDNR